GVAAVHCRRTAATDRRAGASRLAGGGGPRAGAAGQRSAGPAAGAVRSAARRNRTSRGRMTTAVEARARQSLGRSHQRIYATVAEVLADRGAQGAIADIGCGNGDLWPLLRGRFHSCTGVDAVRYDGL